MTLRIERGQARVRLSGEFRSEHVAQVKTEIEGCGPSAVLDLEELDLIDVEGIRFLIACEANGIGVLNASPYIREWVSRERSQPEARRKRSKGRREMKSEHEENE
jgi:hypothetical protein